MLHKNRRHRIVPIATAEELSEKLTEYTWTTCSGFAWAGMLFLNDSTSADGAQEYTVIRDGHEIESITFGWCNRWKAFGYLLDLAQGRLGDDYGPRTIREHEAGSCYACA